MMETDSEVNSEVEIKMDEEDTCTTISTYGNDSSVDDAEGEENFKFQRLQIRSIDILSPKDVHDVPHGASG